MIRYLIMESLRLCTETDRLRCEVNRKRCPLRDKAFIALINWYFLYPIGPRSCNFWAGNKKMYPGESMAILKIASVAVLFKGYENEIESYWLTGRITKRICRALRHARNELNKRHRAIIHEREQ